MKSNSWTMKTKLPMTLIIALVLGFPSMAVTGTISEDYSKLIGYIGNENTPSSILMASTTGTYNSDGHMAFGLFATIEVKNYKGPSDSKAFVAFENSHEQHITYFIIRANCASTNYWVLGRLEGWVLNGKMEKLLKAHTDNEVNQALGSMDSPLWGDAQDIRNNINAGPIFQPSNNSIPPNPEPLYAMAVEYLCVVTGAGVED